MLSNFNLPFKSRFLDFVIWNHENRTKKNKKEIIISARGLFNSKKIFSASIKNTHTHEHMNKYYTCIILALNLQKQFNFIYLKLLWDLETKKKNIRKEFSCSCNLLLFSFIFFCYAVCLFKEEELH